MKLFISYSRKNTKFAEKLVEKLTSADHDPWFDQTDIPGGTAWASEIEKGIINAEGFILIISPDALNSKYVQQEIALAEKWQKPIFPLMFYRPAKLPGWLQAVQHVDFTNAEDFDQSFQRLLTALKNPNPARVITTFRGKMSKETIGLILAFLALVVGILAFGRDLLDYTLGDETSEVTQPAPSAIVERFDATETMETPDPTAEVTPPTATPMPVTATTPPATPSPTPTEQSSALAQDVSSVTGQGTLGGENNVALIVDQQYLAVRVLSPMSFDGFALVINGENLNFLERFPTLKTNPNAQAGACYIYVRDIATTATPIECSAQQTFLYVYTSNDWFTSGRFQSITVQRNGTGIYDCPCSLPGEAYPFAY